MPLRSDMGSLLDDVFTPGDSFNTTNRQAKQSVSNLVGIRYANVIKVKFGQKSALTAFIVLYP
jgi:hypothetical protein